jgi:hypothetical protein
MVLSAKRSSSSAKSRHSLVSTYQLIPPPAKGAVLIALKTFQLLHYINVLSLMPADLPYKYIAATIFIRKTER